MRADAIDQLFSTYLKQPVKVNWQGGLGDVLRREFEEASIELTGVATAWVPLDRVVFRARRARLKNGIPLRLEVEGPRIEMALGQAEVDRWLDRYGLPFGLELAEKGLIVRTQLVGVPVAELETRLELVRGWFVLKPQRAAILGMPSYVSSLFRTYLPVPPLNARTRLVGVGHEPRALQLTLSTDDFEESLTPGLLGRLLQRIMPSVRG